MNNVCDSSSCPNFCESGSEHIEYLNKKDAWADELVIKGATALFGVQITLVDPSGQTKHYSWDDKWDDRVYMFYFSKLHFQALMTLGRKKKNQHTMETIS